jgi:hypothetical protein
MGANESVYEGDVERWDEEEVMWRIEQLGEEFSDIVDKLSSFGKLNGKMLLSLSNDDFEQLTNELEIDVMCKVRLRTELKQISPNLLTMDKVTHRFAVGSKVDAR